MKIAFLIGSPDISGGSYVIFTHALYLKKTGFEVTMFTEEPFDNGRLFWFPEARSLNWDTPEKYQNADFKLVIATWWKTCYWAHKVKGNQYIYFVQSIESRFYPANEKDVQLLAESTYSLPFLFITEATWIRDYLKEKYNKFAHLVKNGIDKSVFTHQGDAYSTRSDGRLRVLVEGALGVPFKNVKKTIEIAKSSAADEVWLLTPTQTNKNYGVDRLFSKIPITETPKVYRSCDVIVKLSYVEGMFGPPLEMFHCGGTAIVYNVSGHDEYIVHDLNAFVAEKDDEISVLKFINTLKDDKKKLSTLKKHALETAEQWPSWEESSKNFCDTLINISTQPAECNAMDMRIKAGLYWDWYILAQKNNSSMRKKIYHFKHILGRAQKKIFSFIQLRTRGT